MQFFFSKYLIHSYKPPKKERLIEEKQGDQWQELDMTIYVHYTESTYNYYRKLFLSFLIKYVSKHAHNLYSLC